MPQALPPKSVLVVDDNTDLYGSYAYHSELIESEEEDICNGKYFTDAESAMAYLKTLEPSELPEVLIVDCIGHSIADYAFFVGSWKASRCGDLYARRMIEVYREKGAKLPHVLFKSAEESIAHKAFKNLVNL